MPPRPLPLAADLFGDIEASPRAGWRDYLPGSILTVAGALAAGFIADRYGAPLTLMALLVGLALNFLSADARLTPGLAFASRSLLRWGIVLAGLRVTFGQIMALGPVALAVVAGLVAATIGLGCLLARRMGLGTAFGALAGGATAICGASAAMALAAALGRRRVGEAQLTVVLVGIAAASALAMVAYPIVAHWLGLGDVQAGFLLGASIHDVAQALGAGYAYSGTAAQTAAIVKLTRVALLGPVLVLVALATRRGGGAAASPGMPWFVVGFFAMAGLNSLGVVPAAVATVAEAAATGMLTAAVTATAIRSPLAQLLEAGARPLIIIAALALALFALALAASAWLIG